MPTRPDFISSFLIEQPRFKLPGLGLVMGLMIVLLLAPSALTVSGFPASGDAPDIGPGDVIQQGP